MHFYTAKKISKLNVKNVEEDNKNNGLFKSLLIIAGTEVAQTSIYSLIVSSFVLNPAMALAVKVGLEIATNLTQDLLLNEKISSDSTNLFFNFGYPLMRYMRELNKLKGYQRSYLREIAKTTTTTSNNSELLKKLHDQLIAMKITGGSDDLRNYTKQFSEFEKNKELMQLIKDPEWIADELTDLSFEQKQKYKSIKNFSNQTKKINKVISLLDAQFAGKQFSMFVTKKWKKKINKEIKHYLNYFKQKFPKFAEAKMELSKTMIPLKHEKEPWIQGIKLLYSQIPHLF